MVRCCKCGVLDDVGESVICEDCNDNRDMLIDSYIVMIKTRDYISHETALKMLEALR